MTISLRTLAASVLVLAMGVAAVRAGDAVATYGGCSGTVPERVLEANPADYRDVVPTLQAGDLLRLDSGTYELGLPLYGLAGEADRCIVIEGPESGPPARFTGRSCCNTVELRDSAYLVIRNLEIDGLGIPYIDAVKASLTPSHHITLENLRIVGHGGDQQTVGISTKAEAWNWVVRGNRIEGAGTGMYFGDSNGEEEFVNSLIEYNTVVDTLGYNIQVKHQNNRDSGTPAAGRTIIRHNVFSKANNSSFGSLARPNLLVGHWPTSGAGSQDTYEIYGNFFWQNPTPEPLFQGEGNIAFYSNLLVADSGSAMWIVPHNHKPRNVFVFHNTIVAADYGIFMSGAESGYTQRIAGNAVLSDTPISGGTGDPNVTDTFAAAGNYLVNPTGGVTGGDRLDCSPLAGALDTAPLDLTAESTFGDFDRDFDGREHREDVAGAYVRTPALWLPNLDGKPMPAIFDDGFESGDVSAWSEATP